MLQFDLYFEFVSQVSSQRIGGIHTPMLTTCAAKTYHQTFKITFDILFHGYVDNIKYTIQKILHPRLLLEVIFYGLVTTMLSFEFCYSTRVHDATAVKNKSTAIAAIISRHALAIRETADLYNQCRVFISLGGSELFDNFISNTEVKYFLELRNHDTHTLILESGT